MRFIAVAFVIFGYLAVRYLQLYGYLIDYLFDE